MAARRVRNRQLKPIANSERNNQRVDVDIADRFRFHYQQTHIPRFG
jgi:hypothetical protein